MRWPHSPAMRRQPDNDPLVLVLAADHVYSGAKMPSAQHRDDAAPYAESGKLVTFGIVPSLPETGYGYIRRRAT
ncbi:sugar phosphate nucleotidyltransferase [Shigella flexneri]